MSIVAALVERTEAFLHKVQRVAFTRAIGDIVLKIDQCASV